VYDKEKLDTKVFDVKLNIKNSLCSFILPY
jgi:hypothetical protein